MSFARPPGRIGPAAASAETSAAVFPTLRSPAMTVTPSHSAAWTTYSYVAFGVAAGMAGLGVWGLPVDIWIKGYLAMAMVFLIGSTFTLAKTVRDDHEARRLTNRLEEAKAEKLLMEIDRAA